MVSNYDRDDRTRRLVSHAPSVLRHNMDHIKTLCLQTLHIPHSPRCQIVPAKVTALHADPPEQAVLAPKTNATAHNAQTKHTPTSVNAPAVLIPADAPPAARHAIVLRRSSWAIAF